MTTTPQAISKLPSQLEVEEYQNTITFLEKVNATIQHNFSDAQFGVNELAQAVYLSVSQLNRRLNQIDKSSAGKMIRVARLQAAAHLLATTRFQSVSEIAYRVGYPNITSFCRSFKREFGCSPRAYGRQVI